MVSDWIALGKELNDHGAFDKLKKGQVAPEPPEDSLGAEPNPADADQGAPDAPTKQVGGVL